MVGNRYGMLVVLEELASDKGGKRFLCKCDCGVDKIARKHHLTQGRMQSCGCRRVKHGCSRASGRTREFIIWTSMKQRCTNPKTKDYPRYGGRGISIHPRWLEFTNFLEDMGKAPKGHTLERIDNGGDYGPDNCKWATPSEQQRNRRNTVFYTVNGKTDTFAGWAEFMGLRMSTLGTLLLKYSMSEIVGRHERGEIQSKPRKLTKETALEVFLSKGRMVDIAAKYGISPATVSNIKARRFWKSVTTGY